MSWQLCRIPPGCTSSFLEGFLRRSPPFTGKESLLRNGADEKADLRNFPSKHFNLLSEWLLVEKTKSTEREGGKEGFAIILTVPIY